jgi:hypothetical protein
MTSISAVNSKHSGENNGSIENFLKKEFEYLALDTMLIMLKYLNCQDLIFKINKCEASAINEIKNIKEKYPKMFGDNMEIIAEYMQLLIKNNKLEEKTVKIYRKLQKFYQSEEFETKDFIDFSVEYFNWINTTKDDSCIEYFVELYTEIFSDLKF